MHLRVVGLHASEALLGLPQVGRSQVIPNEEPIDDWREEANCLHVPDKDIFFANHHTLEGSREIELAVGVCITCPVRVPCLKDGIDQHHGVWGGYTQEELRDLRERIKNAPPVVVNVLLTAAAQRGPSRFL